MKIAPYKLRKVFFLPLFVSIVLGLFPLCYGPGWWRGDVVQISILVAHFLLFAPIAYLLQRKPDDPEFEIINFHNCLLLLHIETAIGAFLNLCLSGWTLSLTPKFSCRHD